VTASALRAAAAFGFLADCVRAPLGLVELRLKLEIRPRRFEELAVFSVAAGVVLIKIGFGGV